MASRLPISVCMIAKNEEKYIEECLKHLMPYQMEIIVVDTGSTDSTRRIASKYTPNVYDFEWTDDFAAARNFAISKATNNWILILDCDEYLIDMDISAIRACMQKHIRHVGVLKLRNLFTKEDGERVYRLDEIPRFFNKNFYEYRFRIHEQITPKGTEDISDVRLMTFYLPIDVEHCGYDISKEEMQKKQERNLRLLEQAVGETDYDDYIYFQIGQSYMTLGEYAKAAEAYKKSFALNTHIDRQYVKAAIPAYARALEGLDRNKEAMEHLLKYQGIVKTAEYEYLLGCAYQACDEKLKALLTLVKVTQMKDFEWLGEQAYDTYMRIMTIHSQTGNMEGLLHFRDKMEAYGLSHGRKIVFQ